MDLFELELASDPRISPDGRTVVYVRQFSDVMAQSRKVERLSGQHPWDGQSRTDPRADEDEPTDH